MARPRNPLWDIPWKDFSLITWQTVCCRNGRQYGSSWNGLILRACSGLRLVVSGQHGRGRGRGCTTIRGGDVGRPGGTCSGESMHLVNKQSAPWNQFTLFPISPCLSRSKFESKESLRKEGASFPSSISMIRDKFCQSQNFHLYIYIYICYMLYIWLSYILYIIYMIYIYTFKCFGFWYLKRNFVCLFFLENLKHVLDRGILLLARCHGFISREIVRIRRS